MAASNYDPPDGGGGSDLVLVDLISMELVPLPGLNSGSEEENPSLSGQGRYIAFYSSRSGRGDIYLYDRELGRLLSLPGLNTPEFTERSPAISGSGRYIAYESNRRGNGNVMLYDRATSSKVPMPGLNDDLAFDGDPSLGDGGELVAFESSRSGRGDIYLYERSTASFLPLPGLNGTTARGPSTESNPSITTDGRFIAFDANPERNADRDMFLYNRGKASLVPLPQVRDFTNQPTHPSIR